MYPQILALVVKDSPEGGTVDIGIAPFVIGALPFIVAIVAIVMLIWYFVNRKRFEHQQIMAAIEKGTPLSEFMPVKKKETDWIKSLTKGIAFLLIGLGWITMRLIGRGFSFTDAEANSGISFAALVLIAIGIAGIIRGILQRKYDKGISSDKSALNANNGQ